MLGGCLPRYYVEPPISAAGRVCAAACATQKMQCEVQASSSAASARASCQSNQAHIIDRCSGIADAPMRHRCEGARGAGDTCLPSAADTSACDATQAQCVLDCGGAVIETRTATSIPVY